jgi:hypothetical protein
MTNEMAVNQPAFSNVFVPPLSDESVRGYGPDRQPVQVGVKDMLKVVKILEEAAVPCCMVAEVALIYYGTGRVKTV